MKVYCLNEEAYGCDEGGDQYVWMAYWYESGYYDGSGEAVSLGKDGYLYIANLGHCSCFGPFEDWGNGPASSDRVTVKDFFGNLNSVHGHVSYQGLEDKVADLLAGHAG